MADLVESSNNMFFKLKRKDSITYKYIPIYLKYFTYEFKTSTNLGKLYLPPKIHKRLYDVPERPIISDCGTPSEQASEFVDFHLKFIMHNRWSYIWDSNDLINKIKNLKNIPSNSILATADVVGLYLSIPHESGLNAIENLKTEPGNLSLLVIYLKCWNFS